MNSLNFGSFLWSAPVQEETAGSTSCLFSLLYKKHNILLILWGHTNKIRPFTIPNYVLLLPLWWKIMVGPLKKMQVLQSFSFHSPHKLTAKQTFAYIFWTCMFYPLSQFACLFTTHTFTKKICSSDGTWKTNLPRI